MNGTYETIPFRRRPTAERAAREAWGEVMRQADVIDDYSDHCTCGQYDRDGEIGCGVPHDTQAIDLKRAVEQYIAAEAEAHPLIARGEILNDLFARLNCAHSRIFWEEILPRDMEDESHEFALLRMERAGLIGPVALKEAA